MSILVVDDEPLIRDWNVIQLSLLGYSSLVATNGLEAINVYKRAPADVKLVILDLNMPVLNGIETYKILRQQSKYLPIVVCSGMGSDDIQFLMKDDGYLFMKNKPYKIREILQFMEDKPLYGGGV